MPTLSAILPGRRDLTPSKSFEFQSVESLSIIPRLMQHLIDVYKLDYDVGRVKFYFRGEQWHAVSGAANRDASRTETVRKRSDYWVKD